MQRTTRLIHCSLALIGILASGTAQAGTLPPPPRVPVEVVKGVNAFADDYLRVVREKDKTGNLIFSPLSISTAFAMLYGGAKGETAAEIRKTMHFPEDPDATQAAYKQLGSTLNIWTRSCQLRTANTFFPQQGYEILPDYLNLLKTNYGVVATPLDYSRPDDAAMKINAWIEEQTYHRIRNMARPTMFDADTRFVLVNALFFKSDWAKPFPDYGTRSQPFQPPIGKPYNVDMMRQTDDFRYFENRFVQVVEMFYIGGRHSMVVLLPKAGVSLGEVEKRFVDSTIGVNLDHFVQRSIDIQLPRFEIDGDVTDLIPILKTLGTKRVFSSEDADLSGISGEAGLFLYLALHKAWIRVDEKGTEAAAATMLGGMGGAMEEPPKPIVFRADHPFLFAIRDRATGALLFLGCLTTPPPARQ